MLIISATHAKGQFPEATPSGTNVIMGWTWLTKTGIMEMYMNCAAINIESSSSSMTVPGVVRASIGGKSAACQMNWVIYCGCMS